VASAVELSVVGPRPNRGGIVVARYLQKMVTFTGRVDAGGLTTPALAAALGMDEGPSLAGDVDWGQVDRISAQISLQAVGFQRATWDDGHFWNVDDDAASRSQFFAIGNSVNFRFWSLEAAGMRPARGMLDGSEYQGAMYMWRALRRALDQTDGRLLEADFLASLSDTDFDRIFADDAGRNPLDPGREQRIANLRDLGAHLLARWNGSFFDLVKSTGGSLVELARLSRDIRAFDDPLWKLTMLTAILHSGSGAYRFEDEPLPAIDYHLLKQTLRQGIVRPNPVLGQEVTASRLLRPEDALELRRLALIAFVGISERTGLSGEVLDNRYWLNRVNCTDPDPVCLDPAIADRCPFHGACLQFTQLERPLELTRYY
jgi:hypothetical protein